PPAYGAPLMSALSSIEGGCAWGRVMVEAGTQGDSEEREAVLGLWAVPGLGPVTLAAMRAACGGKLQSLVDLPVDEWSQALPLPKSVRHKLRGAPTLRSIAARVRSRCDARKIKIAFPGEPAFPSRLSGVLGGPPLLFYRGLAASPRKRIAMVGSR